MNPRDADPYFVSDSTAMQDDIARYSSVPWDSFAKLDPDPLTVWHEGCPNCLTPWKCNGPHEPQYARMDRDRPGITIPLLLAIVVVVAVALAVWGGTR